MSIVFLNKGPGFIIVPQLCQLIVHPLPQNLKHLTPHGLVEPWDIFMIWPAFLPVLCKYPFLFSAPCKNNRVSKQRLHPRKRQVKKKKEKRNSGLILDLMIRFENYEQQLKFVHCCYKWYLCKSAFIVDSHNWFKHGSSRLRIDWRTDLPPIIPPILCLTDILKNVFCL